MREHRWTGTNTTRLGTWKKPGNMRSLWTSVNSGGRLWQLEALTPKRKVVRSNRIGNVKRPLQWYCKGCFYVVDNMNKYSCFANRAASFCIRSGEFLSFSISIVSVKRYQDGKKRAFHGIITVRQRVSGPMAIEGADYLFDEESWKMRTGFQIWDGQERYYGGDGKAEIGWVSHSG